jgi:hypothetical protein
MKLIKSFNPLIFSVVVLVCGTMVTTACSCDGRGGGYEPGPDPTPLDDGSGTQQTGNQESFPDLSISAIEVYPSQPKAGQYFTVNVYVTNSGTAASGEFDLQIHIKDVSRGSTYPVGTFRHERLLPGENIPVYSSQNLMVNYPGSHQIWTKIVPFPGSPQESNEQNNTYGWAFTVTQ